MFGDSIQTHDRLVAEKFRFVRGNTIAATFPGLCPSWAIVIVLACCLVNAGCGLSSGSKTPASTSPNTGSISGSVSPAANGSGTTVTLSGAASATTTADASGNYSFTGLSTGSYTVSPSKNGFTFGPSNQTIAVNGASVTGVNFTAAPSAHSYTVSGSISPAANGSGATVTLSGTASATTTADASGNYSFTAIGNGPYSVTPSKAGFTFGPSVQIFTVNNASISVVNFTAAASAQSFSISGSITPAANGSSATVILSGAASATTTADASGNYSFTALGSGSYTVSPSKNGFSFGPSTQTITVSNANITSVNFTASAQSYSISGSISPAANGSGATVTLSGAASATTTADTSGNYSFTGLNAGSYTVSPSKNGFTFGPSAQTITVSNANMAAVNFTSAASAQSYSISGSISPAANGSGATITLSGAASTTTTADASGNYSFTALGNGSYTVTPSKNGFTFGPSAQTTAVNNANITGLNFTATASAQSYSISGSITPAANGGGATVALSGAASATATADASGSYSFTGLSTGSYTVSPSKNGFTFGPSTQTITVSNANITGVNFTAAASAQSYSISGNITPAANGSGATVALSGAASTTTTADASGSYSFTAVGNGSYTVTPSKNGFSFGPSAQTITVSNANMTGVNFTAASTISGASTGATFFALNDTNPADDPKADGMSYGTMSHPIDLTWNFVEQQKGVFDFSIFDQYAQVAPKDANGAAILVLTLGMTPPWATSNQSSCSVFDSGPPQVLGCTAPPDNIQDWTNFVQALINHYNGTTAPHVKYYEIWNEASCACFFSGTATDLANLAIAAYPIVKQDPYSFVIAPSMVGPASTPSASAPVFLSDFFKAVLASGQPGADISSFHGNVANSTEVVPYPLPGEDCTEVGCNGDIVSIANSYRQVLDTLGINIPLFVTEGGFENAQISDPDQRAAWLAQYYALLGGLYTADQVQLASWFTWGGAAPTSGSIETAQHAPDEGGIAYNQMYSWLVGNTTAPCTKAGTIWTCELAGPNNYYAQIIWDDSQTCNDGVCTTSLYSVPGFTQYRDLSGNTNAVVGDQAPVGLKPILVEN